MLVNAGISHAWNTFRTSMQILFSHIDEEEKGQSRRPMETGFFFVVGSKFTPLYLENTMRGGERGTCDKDLPGGCGEDAFCCKKGSDEGNCPKDLKLKSSASGFICMGYNTGEKKVL